MTDRIELLDPVVEPTIRPGRLAARIDGLAGKTIGLYANMKLNSVELMDLVAKELQAHHGVTAFVRGSYNPARVMRPDEWGDIDSCDAVILTHGD